MSMGDGYGGGYQGFVAGIFSGVTKLAVGHPFDTIKVRMQTNTQFTSSWDCLLQTLRHEGVRGLYRGATPPLVGWMFMDSITMGSLTNYRHLLKTYVWPNAEVGELPFQGKVISAIAAGWTVSFVATPFEHVKALLQVQYQNRHKPGATLYKGPIDCAVKLVREAGVFRGLYHGLFATMVFRTNFAFWWGGYDIFSKWFKENTNMSTAAIGFWAGGLGATLFWVAAYPVDIVKQQIMTDSVSNPRFHSWMDAARFVYQRGGAKAFTRGFMVSFVRSFPTNASALGAFELAMSLMHRQSTKDEILALEND